MQLPRGSTRAELGSRAASRSFIRRARKCECAGDLLSLEPHQQPTTRLLLGDRDPATQLRERAIHALRGKRTSKRVPSSGDELT